MHGMKEYWSHPERESRDPAMIPRAGATGSRDFTRDDRNTPLLRALAAASFPLTGGGSVPTYYAFSGVETAGEH
jgi:hypothetical protein